ncbi:nicotinamidase [Kluyveromyces lactis]|uniref:nicotinamidase n=1 Tax=Kluyveromyces lactis (strain ATCC 8585 / CBS 2359 / DSM 70799 / NBRC 1267 / NRRL Y-1140 / WM37) TaxID=284590 RepID=Q6CJ16_KLULA|nr:uncharacterized protein KLLA0_F22242g [Kluyveromyces lactis]CAG98781.1 KLLA0F22242p [Kluyveromyces lactis]|eukprot:XP_456073.1 uncharacterized protein KLLA0_F22242g [Kluyveromyces lactis]
MGARALLVIDIQNDFLPPKGSLAVQDGDTIIDPVIQLLQDQDWDCVAMTKDWHPPDHISFAKNHGLPDFSSFTYDSPVPGSTEKQSATLWPVHCVQETWGSEVPEKLLAEILKLKVPHKIVNKGYLSDREYYSGFNDIWNDHHTELDAFFKENDVTEIYVVGLAFDFCVKNSAISAANLGYHVTILKDYTKAIANDLQSIESFIQELAKNEVSVQESI